MTTPQPQPPFFFFHLPRTAGTTLNAILRDNFAPEEVLTVYRREEYAACRELEVERLNRLRLIQGHLMPQSLYPPTLYGRPWRIFTFLREPVSRLVSEYRFLRSWPRNHLYAYLNENNISFERYLTGTEHQLCLRGSNFMTHALAGKFRNIDDAEALERAKDRLENACCCFGIQERFDESLLLLAKALGLTNLFYERRNALRQEAPLPPVTESERELAAERNQADAALYAFAVDLLERRIAAEGPAFAQRLEAFRHVNAKYQNVCELMARKLQLREEEGNVIRPKA